MAMATCVLRVVVWRAWCQHTRGVSAHRRAGTAQWYLSTLPCGRSDLRVGWHTASEGVTALAQPRQLRLAAFTSAAKVQTTHTTGPTDRGGEAGPAQEAEPARRRQLHRDRRRRRAGRLVFLLAREAHGCCGEDAAAAGVWRGSDRAGDNLVAQHTGNSALTVR
jgi:hypothetical protein